MGIHHPTLRGLKFAEVFFFLELQFYHFLDCFITLIQPKVIWMSFSFFSLVSHLHFSWETRAAWPWWCSCHHWTAQAWWAGNWTHQSGCWSGCKDSSGGTQARILSSCPGSWWWDYLRPGCSPGTQTLSQSQDQRSRELCMTLGKAVRSPEIIRWKGNNCSEKIEVVFFKWFLS